MTSQGIIYACTAVAALGVAIATPAPPTSIDAALQEDGASFCIAAYREARSYAPNAGWQGQRLLLARQPAAETGQPHRLTCTTESEAPIRITFDVVCPRADSWDCVEVRSVTGGRSGATTR